MIIIMKDNHNKNSKEQGRTTMIMMMMYDEYIDIDKAADHRSWVDHHSTKAEDEDDDSSVGMDSSEWW